MAKKGKNKVPKNDPARKRKPYKKETRPRIKSKSTKDAKGKTKKNLPRAKNDNLVFHQQLYGEVVKFYKKKYENEKLGKDFIKARTKYAYAALKKKAGPSGKITKTAYRALIVDLGTVLKTPSAQLLEKDKYTTDGTGINYWGLEGYIGDHRDEIDQYKEIVVDCSRILPDRAPDTGSAPEEINITEITREINQLVTRNGRNRDSNYLWFKIFKSKNKQQILFELVDEAPGDIIDVDTAGPKHKGPKEPELTEKEKKKTGAAEPPKKEEEKEFLPPLRTAIDDEKLKQEKEKGEIEKLNLKKSSYRTDIKFNEKRIGKLAKLVELYKKIGVDYADDMANIIDLKKINKDLDAKIKAINDRLDEI